MEGIYIIYDDEDVKCPDCQSQVEFGEPTNQDEDGPIYKGKCMGCAKDFDFQIVS